MRKLQLTIIYTLMSIFSFSQTYLDTTINSSTKRILLSNSDALAIGSYGEAHYNQQIDNKKIQNGNMDLHRVILFLGYKFNTRLQFFTEIEYEHVKEVSVEQAFINYRFSNLINLKAGIILIPMGYVNEFHEPTLFNGVERSYIDKYIIPSTWREMGVGFQGLIKKTNLKYQLYMVNGFSGYNGTAKLTGSSGLRSGRQKGAEAMFRKPALTGKVTYFGLNGLRLGLSGYFGKTESILYDGIYRNDNNSILQADSSSVGLSMFATNIMYNIRNFQFTAVGNITKISNTQEYNTFTGSDLGSQIMGWYGELAYRKSLKEGKKYPMLVPFVRYANYDTQYAVTGETVKKQMNDKRVYTGGASLQITPGSILKVDYQIINNKKENGEGYEFNSNYLNVGFGYWF